MDKFQFQLIVVKDISVSAISFQLRYIFYVVRQDAYIFYNDSFEWMRNGGINQFP